MFRLSILSALLILPLLAAAPARAERDDAGGWRFGGDAVLSGRSLVIAEPALDDLFAMAERLQLDRAITGSAHLAARILRLSGRIGGDLYAMGMRIDLDGPVAGDASLMGDTIRIAAPIGGDLRATASDLVLAGPVAGNAALAAGSVTLDGAVAGDLALAAEEVHWGDGARIAGTLYLYGDTAALPAPPPATVPPERVKRLSRDAFPAGAMDEMPDMPSTRQLRLGAVAFLAGLAALAGLVLHRPLGAPAARLSARPLRVTGLGLVTLSALVGSVLFLALSLVGLVLIPLVLAAAGLLALAGLVVAIDALGRRLLARLAPGREAAPLPQAGANLVVAVLVGLLWLVPWLGGIAVMVLAMAGSGALMARLLQGTGQGTGQPATA